MRYVAIIFAILFFSVAAISQPAIQWQKAYGGSAPDWIGDVVQTSDGGYLLLGKVSGLKADGDISAKHNGYDFWLVKTDSLGAIQWERNYGGNNADEGNKIVATTDGGYLLFGNSNSGDNDVTNNYGLADYWLVKITANGTLSWQKNYCGSGFDVGNVIRATSDGGYIMVGYTDSKDHDVSVAKGDYDIWVLKVNATGDIQWEKSYGGSGIDLGYDIREVSEGGYIICGSTTSSDSDLTNNYGLTDYWLIRITATGAISWQKNYGGTMADEAFSVALSDDGGYVVAGSSASNNYDVSGNHGGTDLWVVKTDASGAIVWQKSLGGSGDESAMSVEQEPAGKYILAGKTTSTDGDVQGLHGTLADMWVVALHNDGTYRWTKTIGGTALDEAKAIRKTADGGYIIAGYSKSADGDATGSGNHNSRDYWLVKLSTAVNIQNTEYSPDTEVYPTVTKGVVYVSLGAGNEDSKLQVYNLSGQLITTDMAATAKRVIDLTGQPAGAYFLHVIHEKHRSVHKLVYTGE